MKITVLLFAQLKEAYGSGQFALELPIGARVSDAASIILEKEPFRAYSGLPLRFAVNEEFKSSDSLLNENDSLALLSPVAGG